MHQDLWLFPLASGMQDGLNPSLLIVGAVVLLSLVWLKRTGVSRRWIWLLMASLVINSFVFNCGFFDGLVLNAFFKMSQQAIYIILALLMGYIGIRFLKEWLALIKGKSISVPPPITKRFSGLSLVGYLTLAGFLLSALASLWPVNHYILVFSLYMMMPGQLIPQGSLVLLYTIVSLWFVYLMVWLVCLESRNQRLFKIVAAAVLLSSSLGVIEIFMKG
jgi:hypothetical protein